MEVLVNGQPVKEYPHRDGKRYIEGRRGSEFTLRIRNNTWEKVLAVVSVDGLSVMDGKTAGFFSGGYVIGSRGYVDIPGWRLDNREVAKFFFAELEASYAAQMDKPQNIGVIGCAIFKEKIQVPAFYYIQEIISKDFISRKNSRDYDSPMRGFHDTFSAKTLGAGPSRGIGTGFGERARHEVVIVNFERATLLPSATLELHYAEKEDLLRYGIDLRPRPEVTSPNPFPGGQGCTPPPDWRG